ncbi:hypothetical protein AVEN_141043-1 [Araneus ventricosus]|uniref:Uncharacterized protein n=1 Tax=Araneus ventricosus TaxID=182803 RepID=A0A4Y2TTA7_ARAVE|nr:hypothetical protein AVEN_141043-1 [Araneus ventricosus]
MHFVLSENPPDAGNGKPRPRALHFEYSNLESPVQDVVHSLRCPESLMIVSDSWPIFERNLFQLTSGAALKKNYGWEYTSKDIVPRKSAVRMAHYNLQPRMPNHIG